MISAIMPLERKCRVDQISVVNRLRCDMDTDTMDSRFKSIHGHQYCQVFGDKDFIIEAYPINKKLDCGYALENFVRDYGALDLMIQEISKVQFQPGTDLHKVICRYDIKNRVSEPERSNQNTTKGVIQE